ncbi:ABC transporter substrate-binding protein [Hephaestia sp. GCM10023244]|uniref:ABC transporter substrate-binding protein n=1 Tax=unclassified Hephaestia TaxID=2631281 RepID=UPI0020777D70|nr:ABC transporter substrate-binding protein [Hephaestia sp. MAHUQ-44]MCM8730755.1 ABC transporter substrate-binding protein [Hephaestia sp. MAHUQ-44]
MTRTTRTTGAIALMLGLGLLPLGLLGGCDRRSDVGPVVASVIGTAPVAADPARGALGRPSQMLMASIAQGLVRLDASGQVEPGIAERWIVIDDGMSTIFRIGDVTWPDGRAVTARDVVQRLRRELAADSRNPLRPYLSAIDEVVEMTPEVIEVRMKTPRPDLLRLLARPELAIFRLGPPRGTGPMRLSAQRGGPGVLLEPVPGPAIDDDTPPPPRPEQTVRLIGERAAKAIMRFKTLQSDLVDGGTVGDWPLVAAAEIAPTAIRIDPAQGLFGLAFVERTGFLEEADHRALVAGALDRDAIVAGVRTGWTTTDRILPDTIDLVTPPNLPGWAIGTLDERRARGRSVVAQWELAHDSALSLKIALPDGPGATLLFGGIAQSLATIGIDAVRVAENADADLRLIDAIAPADNARWYLARACAPCGKQAATLIDAARTATSTAARGAAIAEADAALAADVAFIPLGAPLRWSLVTARLDLWQPNARAWHPLNHLRTDTK